jgi:hypothetical protein
MTKSARTVTFVSIAIGIAVALGTFAAADRAAAAPPTVQYSPGYDMRLAEARHAAQLASQRRLVVVPYVQHRHHHQHHDD